MTILGLSSDTQTTALGYYVKKIIFLFSLLICSTHFSTATFAEEVRYVTDSFSITMRTGQGTKHKIVKSPKSGVKMTLIEEDQETGYSHVRLENGLEGWVLSRYLIKEPIAKSRLAAANQKVKTLQSKVKELREKLNATSKSKTGFEKDTNRLSKGNAKLKKELAHIKEIAANQIAINDENKKLQEQVLTLKRNMQTVQQENMGLQDRSARDWFLIGAGVCIVGIVLGLVLPNLRFRRKQSWNSL